MTPPPVERSRTPRRAGRVLRGRWTRGRATAPPIAVTCAFLGWALPRWEARLPSTGLGFDEATAQAALAAIAGGMITLAGFVVTAITLVVQTVMGMSPRLVDALGHLTRYLNVFALLVGSALYALVALSQVRGDEVPRFSVTFAVVLVLVSTAAVFHLLASLRHAVTVSGLSTAIGDRLRTVVDRTCPGPDDSSAPTGPPPSGDVHLDIVHPGRPAALLSVDEYRLVRLAAQEGARVEILSGVGEFVGSGRTVARLVLAEPARNPGRLSSRVAGCLRYGGARTVEQDPAYGFRLLVDIAVRGLSPAVNDPTTAVQVLDQIEDVLARLSGRPLGPAWLLDGAGVPRVAYPAARWEDLVALALDETILYGASSPQVVRRLHLLLDRLLAVTPAERAGPLTRRRAVLVRLADDALPDPLLNPPRGADAVRSGEEGPEPRGR